MENGDARFDGLWNPDVKYSNEYVILPLQSTGGSVETLSTGKIFANVIDSTQDENPLGMYWINYWKKITNNSGPASCCTDGNFYNENGEQYKDFFYCRDGESEDKLTAAGCYGRICGGHVILGKMSATVLPGSPVYLLPICHKHNIGHSTSNGKWGTGFYMKLKNNTNVVKLIGYLQNVKKYIDESGDKIRIA
ncbi:hypothetical protein DWX80_11140 [Ruminococcus sp. AF21-3]|nr:hypothetical protein DWX80_11140 [Ruminococcus sp. AF21-3]